MNTLGISEKAELLFQASGSMKLLRVWMERVGRQNARTWNDNLDVELCRLQAVVVSAKQNLCELICFCQPTAAAESFCDKMQELLNKIDTKEMSIIQKICNAILNQLDYIVNDLDKRRKRLYEEDSSLIKASE